MRVLKELTNWIKKKTNNLVDKVKRVYYKSKIRSFSRLETLYLYNHAQYLHAKKCNDYEKMCHHKELRDWAHKKMDGLKRELKKCLK